MLCLDGWGLGRNKIGRLVTRKCGEEVYGHMDFSEWEGTLKILKCRGGC